LTLHKIVNIRLQLDKMMYITQTSKYNEKNICNLYIKLIYVIKNPLS